MMESEQINPYQPPETEEPMQVEKPLELKPEVEQRAFTDSGDFLFQDGFVPPQVCVITGEAFSSKTLPMTFVINNLKKTNIFKQLIELSPFILLLLASSSFGISNVITYFSIFILLFSALFAWKAFRQKSKTVHFYLNKEVKMKTSVKTMFLIGVCFATYYFLRPNHGSSHSILLIVLLLGFLSINHFIQRYGLQIVGEYGGYFRLRGCHPEFLA